MMLVDWFRFDALSAPWVLLLLIPATLLMVAELLARAPGALAISTGEVLATLHGSRVSALRRMPPVARAVGLAALIVALAGPLHGYQVRRDRADIIDIMLVVDVSGSMTQRDFVVNGELRDRLYVTKAAVRDFIESRKERAGDRYGMDRLGLVLFAGIAWTQCPLTLDYGILEREVDRARVEQRDQRKEGTAIGSAIGLGVQRLRGSEAKSKVIVLLTDGLNNRGELDPITAANIAKEYGIRVYTIGAGSTEPVMSSGFFFQGNIAPEIDEATLQEVSDTTGGKYYRATDLQSLREAYAEIDALEKTEIDAGDTYEYKPAFLPYLLLGSLLVLVSVFSRRLWFEVIP